MAVILAGGEGERLSILSQERAKPAVPFGGKYRIIDFTLSNCVNSGIDDVVVLTQYNPRSLNDHIGLGRPWDLDRNTGGVKLLQPYIARGRIAEWYRGTADAVLRNMRVLENNPADTVLVLAGDHIYKMDYQPFVAAHRRHRADVTIAVRRVPLAEASRMGILAMDENDRVTDWQEKPKQPKSDLASMGVYVFSKKTLRRWLSEDRVDFGANVVPAMLDAGARVFGYRYNGYWQDVGTIQSFWEANMALLDDDPALDLYDKEWVIHTRSEERAPAKVGPTAQVHRSLISHGCVIAGTVVNSVLSPGVRVDVGAVVRESIVMFDSVIRSGAVVDRAILDKEVVIGPGAIVGDGPIDDRPNNHEPGRLNTGITVVGKRAVVPRGARIGRNVKIAADVRSSDFSGRVVRSGESVDLGARRAAGRGQATPRRTAAAAEDSPAACRPGRRSAAAGRPSPRTDQPPLPGRSPGPGEPRGHRSRLDSPGHVIRRPGLAPRAPRRCRRLVHRAGPRPVRARRARGDRQLGPRPRRPPPLRAADHGHPRSGAGGHLLGALRPADQRHVPQVVPQAAALERRVPVRQVLGRGGRAAAAGRRAADRRGRAPTSSAWRSPGSSASPTGCSTNRRTGCGSAAGSRTRATGRRPTRRSSIGSPGAWPSCSG